MKIDVKLFKIWDYKRNNSSNPLLVNSLSPKRYFFICPKCHVHFESRVCDVTKNYCCPSCENKKRPKESFNINIENIKWVITPKILFYIILLVGLSIIIAILFKIYFALINLPLVL